MLDTCVTKQERIEQFKMSGENVDQEVQSKCDRDVSVYLCAIHAALCVDIVLSDVSVYSYTSHATLCVDCVDKVLPM